jgi:hypothetical protein
MKSLDWRASVPTSLNSSANFGRLSTSIAVFHPRRFMRTLYVGRADVQMGFAMQTVQQELSALGDREFVSELFSS